MWHLFDGKSSSRKGDQLVFSPCTPLTTLEPQGEKMVAIVLEDTEKFGQWTRTARLFATSPALFQLCKEALADLEGIMPEYEPSGDREHPAWETIERLRAVISRVEDEWEYDPWDKEVKCSN